MATDRALIYALSVFAAAIETTTGTAATLSATEAKYNASEMSVEPDIPAYKRKGQGSMSALQPVAGPRGSRMSCKVEAAGNGASGDPPWLSTLVAACGFESSGGVWKPKNGPITTLSLGGFYDGRKYLLTGCMGSFTLDAEAGNPAVISYDFMGLHQAPTSVALLAPTYPTVIPPRFANSTLTIGGSAYKIGRVQIRVNNTLVMRQSGEDSSATGYHACAIVDREITISVSPEGTALGTKDWHADHVAGTTAAFSFVLGGSANNTITFAAPKMALLDSPKPENDNGILKDALNFQCVRSAAAGDDELSISQS